MNNKGFTMIELLAVVTILSIILLVSFPALINMTRSDKEREYKDLANTLCKAGETYIYNNKELYPQLNTSGKIIYVRISNLMEEEYVNKSETNPKTGELINSDILKFIVENDKSLSCSYLESEIATDDDYRGYYADVDGDGTPDGIIYADLGANITYPQSGDFYNEKRNRGQNDGTYTYNKATGELNEYTISKDKHTGEKAKFGEKEIIKLKKNKNNPRFYVMALEDFRTGSFEAGSGYIVGSYYWYRNAYGKMPDIVKDTSTDFGTGYDNTGKMIGIWEKNGEGEGSYTEATQDDHDIWKYIKDKYNSKEKWYIPSRGEWGAFVDYFKNNERVETKLTIGNFISIYGLSKWYWSSSQSRSDNVWGVCFYCGNMDDDSVDDLDYVRLGVTF